MSVGWNPAPHAPDPWKLGLGTADTTSLAGLLAAARAKDGGLPDGPAVKALLRAYVKRYGMTVEHFVATWDDEKDAPVLARDSNGNFLRGAVLDAEHIVTNATVLQSMFRQGKLPDAASGGPAARTQYNGVPDWREYTDAEKWLTGSDVHEARAGDRMRGYTMETPLVLDNDAWEWGVLAAMKQKSQVEGWEMPQPGTYAIPATWSENLPRWYKEVANYNGTGSTSYLKILPDTRKPTIVQPPPTGGGTGSSGSSGSGGSSGVGGTTGADEVSRLQSKLADVLVERDKAHGDTEIVRAKLKAVQDAADRLRRVLPAQGKGGAPLQNLAAEARKLLAAIDAATSGAGGGKS